MARAAAPPRRPWPAAGAALRAAALAAAVSLEGCSLITIAYCPEQAIEHGRVRGAWQHDAAVVDCDDGFEYLGGEVLCDESRRSCSWSGGQRVCRSRVELFVRPRPGGRRLAAAPRAGLAGLACTPVGERAAPHGLEAWVHRLFARWNAGNATELAALFAPGARAPGGAAPGGAPGGARLAVRAVHRCGAGGAAAVELVATAANQSANATELLEFDAEGLATGGTGAAMARAARGAGGGRGLGLEVSGLPPNGNDLYLYRVFAPFGAIRSVKAEVAEDGTCTGVGAVVFANAADAQSAREKLDGHAPDAVEPIGAIPSNRGVVLHVSVRPPGAEQEETK